MLIREAELYGSGLYDLRCRDGVVTEIGPALKVKEGEKLIEAGGGVLLPGLHDHHLHLYSLAAARQSLACGPPDVTNPQQLGSRLRQFDGNEDMQWIRGIGYHESVAGRMDRWQVDDWVSDRPVRIQHRSGKMWILNSLACEMLQLDKHQNLEGIERDQGGLPTGRLFRLDQWLGLQLKRLNDHSGGSNVPDLTEVSCLLASYGVTGITDASHTNGDSVISMLSSAVENNQLLQKVLVMGTEDLPEPGHPLLSRGALKIILDEFRLPEFEQLKQRIEKSHRQQRPVAIHCVTPAELILALTALREMVSCLGDRIEHASMTSEEALQMMRETGITVVTQPGFVITRGDHYRADIVSQSHSQLYRCRSFLEAGIPLGGGTDAPFGSPDPWLSMRAAVERRTSGGYRLGEREKLSPEQALQLFTTPAEAPGADPRVIEVGVAADLCLLRYNWARARKRLSCNDVVLTIRDGKLIFDGRRC